MKFGQTLRQNTGLSWSYHSIDYDNVKHFIKEHTTPGAGKTISIPGRTDSKAQDVEDELFAILKEQHNHVDLFVKSKSGEIQSRLDHIKRRRQKLAARYTKVESRIPVQRLQKYVALENDVIKAGEDIRALGRFVGIQRTAFRKLLKKYKKWTGSIGLEHRFVGAVLDDPKSFTKLDLGYLLDQYSATRQAIKHLYDSSVPWEESPAENIETVGCSTIQRLQDAVDSRSKVTFDTAIATVPLGSKGTFASYFVHPENILELQVFLLQHAEFFGSRSRTNSIATPVSVSPRSGYWGGLQKADYHMIVADSLERFVKEQSGLTVDDREHLAGSYPQRTKACVRWNNEDDDAMACLRLKSGKPKSASLKKKHARAFFDRKAIFSAQQSDVSTAAAAAESDEEVDAVRQAFVKDTTVQPLFHYSGSRTRMSGLNNGPKNLTLATLDTGITVQSAEGSGEGEAESTVEFPFGLLLVRQEGAAESGLLAALADSHLVERVRGFSLEYHAVWTVQQPKNMPAPFWLPILSRDIRKLPPVPSKKLGRGNSSDSGSKSTESRGSTATITGSTTAVETSTSNNNFRLDTPPLQAFRKKKRTGFNNALLESEPQQPQQRYWSEYDHPEDGEEDPNAFAIYIDPNQDSFLDRFFHRIGQFFGVHPASDENEYLVPATPRDEEEALGDRSSEESSLLSPRNASVVNPKPHPFATSTFGTFSNTTTVTHPARRLRQQSFIPHFTATCLIAALVILGLAYMLAFTGRHRYLHAVDAGVFSAVICSLVFLVLGFIPILRAGAAGLSLPAWATCLALLVVDAVASGGLIAWVVRGG